MIATVAELKAMLRQAIRGQMKSVGEWHASLPDDSDWMGRELTLAELVLRQHWMNFQLWHVEDEARRRDVGSEVISQCKRSIDTLNQKRNDLIERVDQAVLDAITPHLPAQHHERYNTETLGMAVDRLSILSLKIFHMDEQTRRSDVDTIHVAECGRKLQVLREQHRDLFQGVLDLIDDFESGTKKPKVYFQFKMYNDPSLNPALYSQAGDAPADGSVGDKGEGDHGSI
jgi:hypothetical protein